MSEIRTKFDRPLNPPIRLGNYEKTPVKVNASTTPAKRNSTRAPKTKETMQEASLNADSNHTVWSSPNVISQGMTTRPYQSDLNLKDKIINVILQQVILQQLANKTQSIDEIDMITQNIEKTIDHLDKRDESDPIATQTEKRSKLWCCYSMLLVLFICLFILSLLFNKHSVSYIDSSAKLPDDRVKEEITSSCLSYCPAELMEELKQIDFSIFPELIQAFQTCANYTS